MLTFDKFAGRGLPKLLPERVLSVLQVVAQGHT